MGYNGIIFALATFSFGLQDHWTQVLFVLEAGYPGGPSAFYAQNVGNWVNVASMAVQIIMNWLVDLLVLHQFWMTHKRSSSTYQRHLIILPATMLLASIGLGSSYLAQLTKWGTDIYSNTSASLAIAFTATSVAFNVVSTGLIILRIWRLGRQARRTTGGYMPILIEVLIESASLYTVTAVVFIVTYSINSLLANALAPLLRQIQAICPLLISIRGSVWRTRGLGNKASQQTIRTITIRPPSSPYDCKSELCESSPLQYLAPQPPSRACVDSEWRAGELRLASSWDSVTTMRDPLPSASVRECASSASPTSVDSILRHSPPTHYDFL